MFVQLFAGKWCLLRETGINCWKLLGYVSGQLHWPEIGGKCWHVFAQELFFMSFVFQITSAWTISNILVCDHAKIVEALLSQRLIPKLISLLKSKSSNDELVTESLKCIYILLSKHQDCLRYNKIIQNSKLCILNIPPTLSLDPKIKLFSQQSLPIPWC